MAPVLMEVTIPDEKGGEPLVFLGRLGFAKLSDASRFSPPHAPPASGKSSSSISDTSSDPSFGLDPPCRGPAADADAATDDDGDASSSGDCCSALDDDDDDCAVTASPAAPRVYLQRTSSDCAEAPGSLFAGWLASAAGGGGASEDGPGSPTSYVSAVADAVRGAVVTTAGWVAGSVSDVLRVGGGEAAADAEYDEGDGLMQLLAEARALPSSPPGAAALLRDAAAARRGVRRLEDTERVATLARCEAEAAAVAAHGAAEGAARAAVEADEVRGRAELAGLHASLTRRLLLRRRRRRVAAAAADEESSLAGLDAAAVRLGAAAASQRAAAAREGRVRARAAGCGRAQLRERWADGADARTVHAAAVDGCFEARVRAEVCDARAADAAALEAELADVEERRSCLRRRLAAAAGGRGQAMPQARQGSGPCGVSVVRACLAELRRCYEVRGGGFAARRIVRLEDRLAELRASTPVAAGEALRVAELLRRTRAAEEAEEASLRGARCAGHGSGSGLRPGSAVYRPQ